MSKVAAIERRLRLSVSFVCLFACLCHCQPAQTYKAEAMAMAMISSGTDTQIHGRVAADTATATYTDTLEALFFVFHSF